MGWVREFLTDSRYARAHIAILAAWLVVHGMLHYLTYVPAFRGHIGNLPYFRLHILHEAEFLLAIVYAALTLRWKAGVAATVITALTSIPFLLTPYIFGRDPRPGELRDLATQVAFILAMGGLMVLFIENSTRARERAVGLWLRLSALADISRAGAAAVETRQVITSALGAIHNTLGSLAAVVYALSPSNNVMVMLGQAGLEPASLGSVNLIHVPQLPATHMKDPQELSPDHLPKHLSPLARLLPTTTCHVVLAPLEAQSEVVGLLVVSLPEGSLSDANRKFLNASADQIALAIRNTQLYAEGQRAQAEAQALAKALSSQGDRPR